MKNLGLEAGVAIGDHLEITLRNFKKKEEGGITKRKHWGRPLWI